MKRVSIKMKKKKKRKKVKHRKYRRFLKLLKRILTLQNRTVYPRSKLPSRGKASLLWMHWSSRSKKRI